jgi:lipopolysaccharide transport system permease protein
VTQSSHGGIRKDLLTRGAVDGKWEHEGLLRRLHSEIPLLLAWTRKEYVSRYRQSALGLTWSVLQPMAILAGYGFVLGHVLKVSSDGLPYVAFAYAGLAPWSFLASVLGLATGALLNVSSVVGKVYFPREVVPLAHVLTFALDLAIATGLLFAIMAFDGIRFSYTMFALIPIYALLILLAADAAVFLATVTVFVRDVRYGVPLLTQLLFIGSPIMYSASLLHSGWLRQANPVAVIVTATRDVCLKQRWPDWPLLGAHAAVALGLFVAVIAYVRSVEPRLVDVA